MNKDNIGFKGEEYACNYLENKEYQIIARNFICNQGEIDIVAKNKNELVFIEVKTRTSLEFGNPAEAVDEEKIEHIIKTAKYFLYCQKIKENNIRFDAIEVFIYKGRYRVNHIRQII